MMDKEKKCCKRKMPCGFVHDRSGGHFRTNNITDTDTRV